MREKDVQKRFVDAVKKNRLFKIQLDYLAARGGLIVTGSRGRRRGRRSLTEGRRVGLRERRGRVVTRLRHRRRRGVAIRVGGGRGLEGRLRGLRARRIRVVGARRATRRLEGFLRRLVGRRAAVRRCVPG